VTKRQVTGANMRRAAGIELIQAKQVGDRGAIEPDARRQFLVGPSELVAQTPQRGSPIHGVEVLALEVLDKRQLRSAGVVDQLNDSRNLRPAEALHGSPPTLAGNEFVRAGAARNWSHDNGLHQP
jgi:hypothetical protein